METRKAGALHGRVAIVTGAAGGIGAAAARLFAAEDARLLLTDVCPAPPGTAAPFVPADLSDAAAARYVFDEAERIFGRLDVLFNVAGISGRRYGDGPIDECTEEGWDTVMRVNARPVYACCHHAIPAMRRSGGGSIINLSSVNALVGSPEHFATHAYAASKAAIIGLTRAMAPYYAVDKIRVNCIVPGLTRTPMSERAQNSPETLAWTAQRQRLTGPLLSPESIAEAALFLASDKSSSITGVILPVDGGWLSS